MKHIDTIYKEWSGNHHTEDSCHPVLDSAEACDFAEFYYNERKKEQSQAEQSSMHISYAAQTIRTMPLDQAIQQIKSKLTGQPETAVIDGELVVSVQAEQSGVMEVALTMSFKAWPNDGKPMTFDKVLRIAAGLTEPT